MTAVGDPVALGNRRPYRDGAKGSEKFAVFDRYRRVGELGVGVQPYVQDLGWYCLDGKLRAHYEQHIKIVWDLFAGDKAAPQKHTGKLSRRLCQGHQAL